MEEKELLKALSEVKTNAQLFEILNNDPPVTWIRKHPKLESYRYLSIDKVELLLRQIFGFNYKIEVLEHKITFNAVTVSVRVHYRELDNPYNWYFHDGVGADEPKKVKDKEELDQYAVASSLPLAKTLAIKDACDHFGRLFGADINRTDTIGPESNLNDADKLKKIKKLFEELEDRIPSKDFKNYRRIIDGEEKNSYNKAIRELELIKNQ